MTISIHSPSPASTANPTPDDDWRTAERHLAALDVHTLELGAPEPVVRVRPFGDLQVSDWRSASFEATRTAQLADSQDDALLVVAASAGTQIVDSPEGTLEVRAGSLLLVTTRCAGRVVAPEGLHKRVVRIPLHALASYDTAGSIPDLLLLDPRDDALAGLTREYVRGLDVTTESLSAADTDTVRGALLVLIAGVIRSARSAGVDIGDPLLVLRRRLERWIVAHLSTGAIKVADLASAHNVAVRTVHRAFAATGDTVGTVTRAHRLAAARQDLVTTSLPITTIAHRWGFCDPSHLGRLFREAYAMSPGDYRELFTGTHAHRDAA